MPHPIGQLLPKFASVSLLSTSSSQSRQQPEITLTATTIVGGNGSCFLIGGRQQKPAEIDFAVAAVTSVRSNPGPEAISPFSERATLSPKP